MTPYSRSDHWIHSNCWLVKNEEFRIVEQSHGEGQSPLLSSAQIRHSPRRLGQVQKVKKRSLLLTDIVTAQLLESAEVLKGLSDGELRVEADVLRHEAHEAAGQAEAAVPGTDSEHNMCPDLRLFRPKMQDSSVVLPHRLGPSKASPEDI